MNSYLQWQVFSSLPPLAYNIQTNYTHNITPIFF
jgi:hypothetical protein